eukprot:6993-Heterococcus_DN1.PRE.1
MLDSPPRRRRPVKGSIYRRVNWRNVLIGAAAVVSIIYLSVRSVKRWRRSKQKYISYIGGSASDAGGIRTDYHLGAAYTYFRANVPAEESTGDAGVVGVVEGLPSVPRNDDDIHIVFSTDCGGYQHWQSMLTSYSAARVGQKGRVTRIASGCTDKEKEILTAQAKTLPHGHRVHFTPDFSFDEASQTRYPYYNKPYGLQHFLKYASPPIAESVIVLTDPDFVMMKPFTPFLDETTQYYKGNSAPAIVPPATRPAVTEGFPLGQHYGLGGAWTQYATLADIVGTNDTNALHVTPDDADKYYAVGPPYIAHTRDWQKIVKLWTEYVPATLAANPGILQEMYAYCIATAHLKMPHI